jgi:hypothetical protein
MIKQQQKQGPKAFGNLVRRITIDIDDRGGQRVTSLDYMMQGKAVFLSLPKPQPTDSRHVVLQLSASLHAYIQALVVALVAPADLVERSQVMDEGPYPGEKEGGDGATAE